MNVTASYCAITCGKCGHYADFFDFRATPIGGELPANQYQCPHCRAAWRMEPQGRGTLYESGLYVPPAVKAQPVEARL